MSILKGFAAKNQDPENKNNFGLLFEEEKWKWFAIQQAYTKFLFGF